MSTEKLQKDFFIRDVLTVACDLPGTKLVLVKDGLRHSYTITETEAYRGSDDLACHASKGMTPRTEVMFREGGIIYMYLIYGMYWMLNIVTSVENDPQAVLIRGLDEVKGPGRLSRELGLDRSFNGESLTASARIWLEKGDKPEKILTSPRIGINYAGEPWISKPWRFYLPD